jgi:hypothetical protein
VKAAAEGWRVLYIETEGALNTKLSSNASPKGSAPTSTRFWIGSTITQAIDALDVKEILLWLHKQPVDLVVIDSFVSARS